MNKPFHNGTSLGRRGTLLVGGLAAVLASACCLGPLILMAIGFSGAWISNLTALEPFRPLFIGIAITALLFAWRRIFSPATGCMPGDLCATTQANRSYKLLFGTVSVLVLIALLFPYIAPWFY